MKKECKTARIILTVLFFMYCGLILFDRITTGISTILYVQGVNGVPDGYMAAIILRILGDTVSPVSIAGVLGCLVFSFWKKKKKILLAAFGIINIFDICVGGFIVNRLISFVTCGFSFHGFIADAGVYIRNLRFVGLLSMATILVGYCILEKYEYVLMCSVGGISFLYLTVRFGKFIITAVQLILRGDDLYSIIQYVFAEAMFSLPILVATVMYGLMSYILLRKRKSDRNENLRLEETEETKSLGEDNAEV